MLPISNYDIFIFDCDGVILDSNKLKLNAMEKAISHEGVSKCEVNECIDYFSKNFGKSRFHHIEYFLSNIISLPPAEVPNKKESILNSFSKQCKKLYLSAEITPNFIDFLTQLDGTKYVASGSEQEELRYVFRERNLSKYFKEIFGSPTKKSELVNKIISKEPDSKVLMFGDAESDFDASKDNGIDFCAYLPFSNVPEKLMVLSRINNFKVIDNWSSII